MEVRAAIDLLVVLSDGQEGEIRGHAIGQPHLLVEMSKYAPLVDSDTTRILALGVAPDDLRAAVVQSAPEEVVTIVSGLLATLVRPLRTIPARTSATLAPDLPRSEWHSLGYALRDTSGVQGIGSLFWVGCERLAHRAGRPDLADRCRIAMLRTLVLRYPFAVATIRLRRYRRVPR
jgi:hypothetical protein